MTEKKYFVTVRGRGDRVEGPFDDHSEAKLRAADLNTHEVNTAYRVDSVRGGEL